jgi:hypothetical protein
VADLVQRDPLHLFRPEEPKSIREVDAQLRYFEADGEALVLDRPAVHATGPAQPDAAEQLAVPERLGPRLGLQHDFERRVVAAGGTPEADEPLEPSLPHRERRLHGLHVFGGLPSVELVLQRLRNLRGMDVDGQRHRRARPAAEREDVVLPARGAVTMHHEREIIGLEQIGVRRAEGFVVAASGLVADVGGHEVAGAGATPRGQHQRERRGRPGHGR